MNISKLSSNSSGFLMWTLGLYIFWLLVNNQLPQFIALMTTSSWTPWSPTLFGGSLTGPSNPTPNQSSSQVANSFPALNNILGNSNATSLVNGLNSLNNATNSITGGLSGGSLNPFE